jgi:hypothetical protein
MCSMFHCCCDRVHASCDGKLTIFKFGEEIQHVCAR